MRGQWKAIVMSLTFWPVNVKGQLTLTPICVKDIDFDCEWSNLQFEPQIEIL